MHYGALSRPALVQGGPAPELSLVPIAFVAGKRGRGAVVAGGGPASSTAPIRGSSAGR